MLQQFRRAEWSDEPSLDAGSVQIELCESSFYVKLAELEAWLKRTGGSNREVHCVTPCEGESGTEHTESFVATRTIQ